MMTDIYKPFIVRQCLGSRQRLRRVKC